MNRGHQYRSSGRISVDPVDLCTNTGTGINTGLGINTVTGTGINTATGTGIKSTGIDTRHHRDCTAPLLPPPCCHPPHSLTAQ